MSAQSPPGPNPDNAEFKAGDRIMGRFLLKQLLGYGAYDEELWLAENEIQQREVTLQMVPSFLRFNDEALDEIADEVRQNLKLNHETILPNLDFVRSGGLAAIEMAPMPEGAVSLADLAANRKRQDRVYSVDELSRLVDELCTKMLYHLHHTHSRPHGDLRSEDIYVRKNGKIRVIGIGVTRIFAKWALRLKQRFSAGERSFIAAKAPEQVSNPGATPTVKGDIYGIGALFFELLTGEKPHEPRPDETLSGGKVTLLTPGGKIPEGWRKQLAACLSEDPMNRPGSAYELGRVLSSEHVYEETPVEEGTSNVLNWLYRIGLIAALAAAAVWLFKGPKIDKAAVLKEGTSAFYTKKDPAKSAELFGKVLKADRKDLSARLGRAESYLGMGETKKAIKDLNKVLSQHPTHVLARNLRARANQTLGAEDAAQADFSEAWNFEKVTQGKPIRFALDRPAYKVGDDINMQLNPESSDALRVYRILPNQQIHLVFPDKNGLPPQPPYRIKMKALEAGTMMLIAVRSATGFTDTEAITYNDGSFAALDGLQPSHLRFLGTNGEPTGYAVVILPITK